jgi:SLBB domain
MIDYIGGANVVTATGIFLHDNAFLTYMVLLTAVLGFAALVRNMGVIRAIVFSSAVTGIAWLLWINALGAALDEVFRCLPPGGCAQAQVVEKPNEYQLRSDKENRPIYILGAVENPGVYPYTDGLDASGAIALAGGIRENGLRTVVLVQFPGEAGMREVAPSTLVTNGSIIRVPSAWVDPRTEAK